MILFMSSHDTTTSSLVGVAPPTSPVFPPCGTTAILRAWQ